MTYEEFLTLAHETPENVDYSYYENDVEPRYMRYDGLSKKAFCILWMAGKSKQRLLDLTETMERGFKSEAEMRDFLKTSQKVVDEINALFE